MQRVLRVRVDAPLRPASTRRAVSTLALLRDVLDSGTRLGGRWPTCGQVLQVVQPTAEVHHCRRRRAFPS